MSARPVSARPGRARRDNIADESYADGEAPVIAIVPKSDETIARIERALEVRALCRRLSRAATAARCALSPTAVGAARSPARLQKVCHPLA